MAEETKTPKETKEPADTAAPPAAKKLKKKKSRPTNCAQSNKRIRRKDWYYRDGKYFANKQCFKLNVQQELEKSVKAKEAAAQAAAAAAATAAAPAEAKPAGE